MLEQTDHRNEYQIVLSVNEHLYYMRNSMCHLYVSSKVSFWKKNNQWELYDPGLPGKQRSKWKVLMMMV